MSKAREWPGRIYLLPDTGDEGETTWCDDPAPGLDSDSADAIEYVRADAVLARIDAAVLAERARCAAVARNRWQIWAADESCPVCDDVTACKDIAAAIETEYE